MAGGLKSIFWWWLGRAGGEFVTLYNSIRLHRRHGTRAAINLADVGCATITTEGLSQASLTFAQIDSAAIVTRGGGYATITNQSIGPLE